MPTPATGYMSFISPFDFGDATRACPRCGVHTRAAHASIQECTAVLSGEVSRLLAAAVARGDIRALRGAIAELDGEPGRGVVAGPGQEQAR